MSGSVVALRALGLGDLLTGVPALRALRRADPQARLLLAAPAALTPLVTLIGGVDEVVDTGPFTTRAPDGPLDPRLHRPDLAVNLHGAGPQSTELLAAGRPGRLVAYGRDADWSGDEHEVARWCRLLDAVGIPADPSELGLAVPDRPSPAPGAIIVHPGAAYGSRRWPGSRWARVARGLRRHGPVVVTGGPDERELVTMVVAAAGLPPDAALAGRTGPAELAALVAAARLVVAPDTGIGHLASAYGTPSVLLFGPVDPRRWGPPARPQHTVLWAGMVGDPFADSPAEGLLAIGADEVLAAAESQLRS